MGSGSSVRKVSSCVKGHDDVCFECIRDPNSWFCLGEISVGIERASDGVWWIHFFLEGSRVVSPRTWWLFGLFLLKLPWC